MSGVDYSNPLVTKQDVQRVEQRIQTNTTLTQIPLASAANVLYYDASTKNVSYNTAPTGASLSGASFRCLSGSSAESFAITVATDIKLPIFTTGTLASVYNTDFTAVTAAGANQNSIIYNGAATKRFAVRVQVLLGTLAGAGSIGFALTNPSTGGFVANGTNAVYYTFSSPGNGITLNFEFRVTMATGQKIELWGKAISQTFNITNDNARTYNGINQVTPGVSISMDEIPVA